VRKIIFIAFVAGLLYAPFRICAQKDTPANALLLLPSANTAFDVKFQTFLDSKGARLLQSFPPTAFIGYIPKTLDAELKRKYGALVYRDKAEDMSEFFRRGESAVFAVNAWNKRFVEDPPEAPLIVSSKVQRAGKKGEGINLSWNGMMKAVSYRLQISTDEAFSSVSLNTTLKRNSYKIFPAFWKDGVYYWRVSGIMTLNNGERKESGFSAVDSFAVSKPQHPVSASKPTAPALSSNVKFRRGQLRWDASSGRYYRLQLSETKDFSAPAADVFTDTCNYKTEGLDIKSGSPYYMRVMASDGWVSSGWSSVFRVLLKAEDRISGNKRPGSKTRGAKR